jgi:phosphotransferase system  glucose/maltose/N-acetylglucosamine-specific IIC component
VIWIVVGAVGYLVCGLFGWSSAGFFIGEAYVFRQWWELPVRGLAFLLGPMCVALLVVAYIVAPIAWLLRKLFERRAALTALTKEQT